MGAPGRAVVAAQRRGPGQFGGGRGDPRVRDVLSERAERDQQVGGHRQLLRVRGVGPAHHELDGVQRAVELRDDPFAGLGQVREASLPRFGGRRDDRAVHRVAGDHPLEGLGRHAQQVAQEAVLHRRAGLTGRGGQVEREVPAQLVVAVAARLR